MTDHLASLMKQVARALLGEPNAKLSDQNEWRFGRRGSLCVDLRTGTFIDFATMKGGGVVHLVERKLGLRGAACFAWLRGRGLIDDDRVPPGPQNSRRERAPTPVRRTRDDDRSRMAAALRLWDEARDPRGTIVCDYLTISRGLALPDEAAGEVIRFHPALRFDGAVMPGMIALFRDIKTNEACAIHRTFFPDPALFSVPGWKPSRRWLGRAGGAAIKLDADENVAAGLHIGEGIETCLAAAAAGFRPIWAIGSAGAIRTFPTLAGIEALTILGEVNDHGANARAAAECAQRWINAGCEAFVVEPLAGDDLNDCWRAVT